MQIPEETVAEVVKEASARMSDSSFTQTLVGSWVQQQPSATRYVTAHTGELGGAEGVVRTVFHAALLASCFERHAGRAPRAVTFADLDSAAAGDQDAELRRRQPALHDYLVANVEEAAARGVLVLVALALDRVS